MLFAPSPWLRGPHLMTVGGRLAPAPWDLPVRRERWELPDGDFLDVDRLEAPEAAAGIVVLHGLEGSSRAGYVRLALAAAHACGLAAWALNFRGCSGEPNRLPRLYHSGETGDLAHAIDRLVAERPERPLGLLGFSLGGNVTAKYLWPSKGRAPPRRSGRRWSSRRRSTTARCAAALDGPGVWALIYRRHFLRSLKAKARAKAARFPEALDARRIARARTFRDFDGWVTAPLHGFADAEDYWARSSSGPLLDAIRRPLLVLQAEDDPFVPFASLPQRRRGPHLSWEVSAKGGHLGFVEGPPWRLGRWAERRAIEFLVERLR